MKVLLVSSKYSSIDDAFNSQNYVHTGPSIPADEWRRLHPGIPNHVLSAGRGRVAVVIHDGSFVLVDAADYDLLRHRGWLGQWTRQRGNQPRIRHGRRLWSLARLIVGADSGVRISFRNRNIADLTRSNLIVNCGDTVLSSFGGTCPWASILSRADALHMHADTSPVADEAVVDHHIATGLHAVLAATSTLLSQLGPQSKIAVRRGAQA